MKVQNKIFSPSLTFAFLLIATPNLCKTQTVTNGSTIRDDDDNNEDEHHHHALEWWQILLIAISMIILVFIIAFVVVTLVRHLGIKKRQKKIDNFKETYDENNVQKQMRNLYEIAPRLARDSNSNYKISPLTELEPTYESRRAKLNLVNIHNYDSFTNNNTYQDSNITPPPSRERKGNESYSKSQKLKRSSALGSMNRKVRYYFDDEDGFEIVVADKGVKASPRTLHNEGYYTGGDNLSRSNSRTDNSKIFYN